MKLKKLIIWICILGLVTILGCASFQDAITPCYISPEALEYANEKPTSILPITTLLDAKRVSMKMDYVHSLNQLSDTMYYEFLREVNSFHMGASKKFQAAVFSPIGPIGLLVPTITAGTLGALLISKPDDKKKIKELEEKNGTHKNPE